MHISFSLQQQVQKNVFVSVSYPLLSDKRPLDSSLDWKNALAVVDRIPAFFSIIFLFEMHFFFSNSLFMSLAHPVQVHCLLVFCLPVSYCSSFMAMFGKRAKKDPSQSSAEKFII